MDFTGVWKTISNAWGNGNQTQTNSVTTSPKNICCVCKEVLKRGKDPRFLSCKHAICLTCIPAIEYLEVAKCKICNQPTFLDNGVSSLPKVFDDDYDSSDEENVLKEPMTQNNLSKSFIEVNLRKSEEPKADNKQIIKQDEIETEEEDFVILKKKEEKFTPNYYIPFTQKKEACSALIQHWISTMWFAPSDFDETIKISEPKPIYFPFYFFKIHTESHYKAEISGLPGEAPTLKLNGKLNNFHDELAVCASFAVEKELIMNLLKKPNSFSLTSKILPPELVAYSNSVKIMEEALSIDINQDDAFVQVTGGYAKIEESEKNNAIQRLKQDYVNYKIDKFTCKTEIKKDSFIILLPIYVSSYEYAGSRYDVLISGARGAVEGKRPYGTGSLGKIIKNGMGLVSKVVKDSI